MLLRAAGAITAIVIGFAGVTSPALAQIYPPSPRYVPPPPPFRQLPPADLFQPQPAHGGCSPGPDQIQPHPAETQLQISQVTGF